MKILLINTVEFKINGMSTVIMNYYRNIKDEMISFDFVVNQRIENIYLQEIKERGDKVFILKNRKKKLLSYFKNLRRIIRDNHYDIVHVHGNSCTMAIDMFAAKLAGCNHIIAHSHNSTCKYQTLHKLLRPLFELSCTNRFACGEMAGKWLFGGKKFEIINNGFVTDKFSFNNDDRDSIRRKLKINKDALLIGHIGQFNYQKNHPYLLEIFEKIAEKNDNSYLLLIGNGPDYEKIEAIIKQHKFKNRIILYGVSNNTAALYSAMDILAFPSRFEGLPVTLIEAQINGLPCVISDKITREVDFGDVKWHSIDEAPEEWCEDILSSKISLEQRKNVNIKYKDMIEKYNIKSNAEHLVRLYYELCEERKGK